MAGSLLPAYLFRATNAAGDTLSGAKLYFYQTGTLTPQSVYTTSAVSVAHPNPLVADSGGLFPAVYPDPTKTYRAILKTSADVAVPGGDVDPVFAPQVNAAGSITSSMLASGAAVANIGYTPLNKAGDTATDLRLAFGATLQVDNAGYLGMPVTYLSSSRAMALSDVGHLISQPTADASARTWTIQPVATINYPVGSVIGFRMNAGGGATLARGAGVDIRIAGNATSQNVALAQWTFGALTHEFTNGWVWSGVGGS